MQLTNKPGNGQPEMASLKEKGACACFCRQRQFVAGRAPLAHAVDASDQTWRVDAGALRYSEKAVSMSPS